MRYCFDIDGVICRTVGMDYAHAQPIWGMIAMVKLLQSRGHAILFYTARGSLTGIDWKALTQAQLESWGLGVHDGLFFGKPAADYYIDDKAMAPTALDVDKGKPVVME
mgnify:FL=1